MRVLFHVFVFSMLLLILAACRSKQSVDESADRQPKPVELHTIEERAVEWKHRFPAIVRSAESRQLYFQIAGIVEEVLVKEAERVKEGDLLIQLNNRTYTADLNSAQAQYEKAMQKVKGS